VPLVCSPVVLLDVSKAGLMQATGSVGVLLFSQCNMVWKSFVWDEGSGYEVLILLVFFLLPRVAPVSQQNF
jgi:hypothetical protein